MMSAETKSRPNMYAPCHVPCSYSGDRSFNSLLERLGSQSPSSQGGSSYIQFICQSYVNILVACAMQAHARAEVCSRWLENSSCVPHTEDAAVMKRLGVDKLQGRM